MQRKIEQSLVQWSRSKARKPLIVNGARQVGKTYSLLDFGRNCYESVVHIDFSAQPAYRAVFEGDITPSSLVPQLEALSRTHIEAGKTLLVFDEVQMCPRALTSLKYFHEQASAFHVAAAGSLLGVTLARGEESFPVGKVDMLAMNPLDFEEFMWAAGEEALAALIPDALRSRAAFSLHDRAMQLYRDYLLVGGMPEAVLAYCAERSVLAARQVQDNLVTAYVADMAKHSGPAETARILGVWDAVPQQLSKDNHKFQYATIGSSARAHQYESAITWLLAAGMLLPCYKVDAGTHPLRAHEQHDLFKLYQNDCGLLACRMGADAQTLASQSGDSARLRGVLAENYVAQQLHAMGTELFYWGVASKSEVDFVVDGAAGAVPIEVKSGENVTARSLTSYRRKYSPTCVVRISAKHIGEQGDLLSVPLYAVHCLDKELGL